MRKPLVDAASRLLIVEDDPALRSALEGLAARDGYDATLVFDKDSGHLVQMIMLPRS